MAGHVFKGRDVLAFGYAMDFGKAKEDLRLLLEEAKDIFNDEMIKQVPTQAMKAGLEKLSEVAKISTPQQYHTWYSRILPFMRQLGPDRFPEFVGLYEPDPKRKNADWLHYTLQDYMRSTTHSSFDRVSAFSSLFQQQIMIVEAVYWTADQQLNDLELIVRADLFRQELDAAEELLKKGAPEGGWRALGRYARIPSAEDMCCSKRRAKKEERDNCRLQ